MKTRLIHVMAVITGSAASLAVTQFACADDAKPSATRPVYAKIILPMRAPAEGTQPVVESWIARNLEKRGHTELRAVTDWVRLAEPGEEIAHVWNATLDGKTWGCPVVGRVLERTADGRVKVLLHGWSPVVPEIRGQNLPDEIGSRRIGVVDTGSGDDSGRAWIALFVGPPPTGPRSPEKP
jgi:hypothetical protein